MFCDKRAAVFIVVCRFPERDQTLEIFQPAALNKQRRANGMGFDNWDCAGLTPSKRRFCSIPDTRRAADYSGISIEYH
ncbi:MAG TPA: hypothetical protein VN283_12575 [Thiobacillus sp.]|nr:hypothetical protein [Thiobacillus sp.]